MPHEYRHNCGCSTCCRHEDAMERDEEAARPVRAELAALPGLLEEVVLTDDEAKLAAAALAAGNNDEFASVWTQARDRYVGELIEARMREAGYGEYEAAAHLVKVYS